MARIERTKNTIAGAFWGAIEKISSILLPFVVRTVLIKKLGSEYLGLSSLFSSILQVLNLTELGFGSAAVFALYKPIAEDDYKTAGAILYYLKRVYKVIGIITICMGLGFTPFLKYLISGGTPPNVNIYVLFIIYILNTSVSYLLFAHKHSLLSALQLSRITSKIMFLTNTAMRLCQIMILLIVPNYYLYIIFLPVFTILSNVMCSVVVDRDYQQWMVYGELDSCVKKDIQKKLFPLMSTKLAGVMVNSADTLVVSAFLGLTQVAVYNNYYYILNSVSGFLIVIYGAMQAGVGNALVLDDHGKIMSDFRKFNFINNWIVTFCTTCLLCLYQPFMELWVGKELMLSFDMVILFCVYFYTSIIWRIVIIYKDAAGIWKEDMLRVYFGCTLNLVLNICTVKRIGLYGVIGSSVLSNILVVSWMGFVLYKNVFRESSKRFYLNILKNSVIAIFICTCTYLATKLICGGFVGMVLKGMICIMVSNALMFVIYRKDKDFDTSVRWVKSKFIK